MRSGRRPGGVPWRDPSTARPAPSVHIDACTEAGSAYSHSGESELGEGSDRDNVIRVGFGVDGRLTRPRASSRPPSQPAPPRSDPRDGLYTVAEGSAAVRLQAVSASILAPFRVAWPHRTRSGTQLLHLPGSGRGARRQRASRAGCSSSAGATLGRIVARGVPKDHAAVVGASHLGRRADGLGPG